MVTFYVIPATFCVTLATFYLIWLLSTWYGYYLRDSSCFLRDLGSFLRDSSYFLRDLGCYLRDSGYFPSNLRLIPIFHFVIPTLLLNFVIFNCDFNLWFSTLLLCDSFALLLLRMPNDEVHVCSILLGDIMETEVGPKKVDMYAPWVPLIYILKGNN